MHLVSAEGKPAKGEPDDDEVSQNAEEAAKKGDKADKMSMELAELTVAHTFAMPAHVRCASFLMA